MRTKIIFLFVSISMLFSTCASDVYNPDICFQEDVLPIFVNKCATSGCHSTADQVKGYDLSYYEGIMKGIVAKHPLQSEIYKSISGNNPEMPEGGELSRKEISYIKIWIKMGAKNTSNCKACDTSNYSYSGKIRPLMDLWCVRCHGSGGMYGSYDFTTYTGIVQSITADRLLGSIKHSSGYAPMPEGTSSQLSDCDVTAIQKWINLGYPEN